jgi:hypothetical protein
MRKRFAYAGLVILFLLIACFVWWKHEAGTICTRNEYTNQKDCPSYRIGSFVGIKVAKTLDDFGGVIQTITAVVVAWFTFAITGFTRRQVALLERQSESAERQSRAFVFVKEFFVRPVTIGNNGFPNKWEIGVRWHNSGTTPTKYMLHHLSATEFAPNLPDNYDFPDLWGKGDAPHFEDSAAVLGPGAAIDSEPFPIDAIDADKIRRGEKVIYMWGWAEYDDIFPDSVRHRTEFCCEVVPGDPNRIKTIPFMFRLYRTNNGADDECVKKPSPYSKK